MNLSFLLDKYANFVIILLFYFFVDGVLIAVGAELFQFQSASSVPTVFGGSIAGNTSGAFVGIR